MTTTGSSSSSRFGAIFRAALKNQMPFAIISGILSLILYPVVFFASISDSYTIINYRNGLQGLAGPAGFFMDYFHSGVYAGVEQSAVVASILVVLALASVLFGLSYMHSKKTVDLYHALPVKRPHLLSANLLASFSAIVAPWLAVYAVTMLVQLVGFGRYGWISPAYFGFILFDIISIAVYLAAVLAFVAFIAVNVGTVFDSFAVSMAMGFSPPVVYLIGGVVFSNELYGATFNPDGTVLYLSPFLYHFQHFMLLDQLRDYTTYNYASSVWIIVGGLVAAAVFFAAAVACYNRRKSEVAEQTQATGVFQMIVKCVAAFMGAAMFYGVFNSTPFVVKLFAMLFGAVLIGIVAELILSRGVKNLAANLKWLGLAGACCCVALLLVRLDVFGYVTRVPDASTVASVAVNYDGRFTGSRSAFSIGDSEKAVLTNPESIEIVTRAHRIAVANPPPSGTRNYDPYDPDDKGANNQYDYEYLILDYTLKNGSHIRRTYRQIFRPAFAELVNLENKEDFVSTRCALFTPEENLPAPMAELVRGVYAMEPLSIDYREEGTKLDLDMNGRQRLLDALRADLLSETVEEIKNPGSPALGYLQIIVAPIDHESFLGDKPAATYEDNKGGRVITIVVTREFRNTLALLPPDAFTRKQAEIVRAAVEPMYYASSQSVQTFVLGGSGYYDKDSMDEDYAWTDDPAELAQLRASAQSRLITGVDAGSKYVTIRFYRDDGMTVAMPVRIDDLPAGLRARFEASPAAQNAMADTGDNTVTAAMALLRAYS